MRKNSIALIGMDGSGKTTQAHIIKNILSHYFNVKYVHLFSVGSTHPKKFNFKYIFDHIKKTLEMDNKNKYVNYLNQCFIIVGLLLLSWLTYFRNLNYRNTLIIYDRYYYDRIINNVLPYYHVFSSTFILIMIIVCKLFPKPKVTFLFNIKPQLSISRKNELTLSEAKILSKLYAITTFFLNVTIISSCENVDTITYSILDAIGFKIE